MEDSEIIELFQQRSEQSISELSKKYGRICRAVAQNILGDFTDAEECLNDAYMQVWNSIPPAKPDSLPAFAAKITKNLALMRVRFLHAKKRGGGEKPLSFEELDDLVSNESSVESAVERKELLNVINTFLKKLPDEKQRLFVRRYWGYCSISELAAEFGMSEGNVAMTLGRIRKKLKDYLIKKGYYL